MSAADPWDAPAADPWAAGLAARRCTAPQGGGTGQGGSQVQQPLPPPQQRSDDAWHGYRQGQGAAPFGITPSFPATAASAPCWGALAQRPRPTSFGRRFKHGHRGERTEVIEWQGLEIVPVRKDFSPLEHPAVAALTEEECEAIRAKNSILVVRSENDEVAKPVECFEEAPFPDWVAAELRRGGFERPTPLQVQAWPVLLKGHDFVGVVEAAGGSGKTLAYVLPMLVHAMGQPDLRPGEGPIGLVLVPTDEHCLQVAEQVQAFTSITSITCRAFPGGGDGKGAGQAVSEHDRLSVIAVAIPSQLVMMLNNQGTNLRRATFIVLDEADELIRHGFGDQVRLILGQVRPDRQALVFSSTWSSALDELTREVCNRSTVHISLGSITMAECRTVLQRFYQVNAKESKPELLCSALDQVRSVLANNNRKALVFCNSSESVRLLVEELQQRGYPCEGVYAEQSDATRQRVLQHFVSADSSLWLLICTQLMGCGHEFPNVRYVINYDMPYKIVEYIHRIGRTGRGGEANCSLTFLMEQDHPVLHDLAMVLRESQQELPEWLKAGGRRCWSYGYQQPSMRNSARWRDGGGKSAQHRSPAVAPGAFFSAEARCGGHRAPPLQQQQQLPGAGVAAAEAPHHAAISVSAHVSSHLHA